MEAVEVSMRCLQTLALTALLLLSVPVHAEYPDECLGGMKPSAESCPPALTFDGCCDDQGRAVYCQGGKLYCLDCPGLSPSCGWNPGKGYNCGTDGGPDPSGIYSPTCNLCEPPCEGGKKCVDGVCVHCSPTCGGKTCGPDGCGGQCGACPAGQWCEADGSCAAAPICPVVEEIACGQTVQGTTAGVEDSLSGYECSTFGNDGGEAAFVFTPAASDFVRFELECPDASLRLHLAHSQCTPSACYWSNPVFIEQALEGGIPYFIILDGPAGKGGPFSLKAVCQSTCAPDCGSNECGPDGCFGECGQCGIPAECFQGECTVNDGCLAWYLKGCGGCACEACVCQKDSWCCEVAWDELCATSCQTTCGGCQASVSCGDGVCTPVIGEACDTCPEDCPCDEPAFCYSGACCAPQCGEDACGEDDGCGGTCATCGEPSHECVGGSCVCQPQCGGKECGFDGCGGDCGSCPGSQEVCVQGGCVCAPSCELKTCGDDGCGGSCGECNDGASCTGGLCLSVPDVVVHVDVQLPDLAGVEEDPPSPKSDGGCCASGGASAVVAFVVSLLFSLAFGYLRRQRRGA
jgi:hypothetical protein